MNYIKTWLGIPELELRVLTLENEIQKLSAEWNHRYENDISQLASMALYKKYDVASKKAAKKDVAPKKVVKKKEKK